MYVSLRAKIMAALLALLVAGDGLATWVVHARLVAGSQREADRQARDRAAQVRALYDERLATLAAEGEAISLYPAVIAAIGDNNPAPLRQWAGQVAALQGTSVTVTDAAGKVIARGHAPDRAGDNLAPKLEGLRLALAGQRASGADDGDELGLALRGYVPVVRNNAVVGAVMIADPLDSRLLGRFAGREGNGAQLRVEPGAPAQAEGCEAASDAASTCRFAVSSPAGKPVAALALTVPLADVAQARADALRALWLAGLAVLVAGALAAWLLARSLTGPLARLTAAADRVGAGAYDVPLGAYPNDEIGVLARAFDAMREKVAATTAALRTERDVRDAVLDSTEDGILMVDRSGAVAVVNGRWRALAGDGLGAAAGLERVDGASGTFGDAARSWLADPGSVERAELEQVAPYRRIRCYTAPVRHRAGATIGRIFALRDVTEERAAERMRAALLATVSHELRSPLTAIAGYTDSLLNGGPWDSGTQRELLQIVAQAAATLAGLVDNLLDAAAMEAGAMRLELEPVRVERIAERVVAQRRAMAPRHALAVEAAPHLPLAHADPLRTEQVLANLVDNAIKYSPEGGPVTLRITADDGAISVRVSDRGVGILPDQAERLFERFYRADGPLAKETKGVGLGLFICKSIVEAHGGRISAASGPGAGSVFTFTLPRLADPNEPFGISRTAAMPRAGVQEGVA